MSITVRAEECTEQHWRSEESGEMNVAQGEYILEEDRHWADTTEDESRDVEGAAERIRGRRGPVVEPFSAELMGGGPGR